MATIACAVPFCGRTCAAETGWREFLCCRHYRLADKRARRLRTRVKRKAGRIGWTVALQLLENRLWARCRAQAIERAAGL